VSQDEELGVADHRHGAVRGRCLRHPVDTNQSMLPIPGTATAAAPPVVAEGVPTECLVVVPARPVLDTLARMIAAGTNIKDVVADRGYTYKND
jgi:hypothetical protein